jgi:hypothetical protein
MRRLLALLSLILIYGIVHAQINLPIEVQAELLQQQIFAEIGSGDKPKAIGSLDRYRQLGTPIPPALLYAEAVLVEKDDAGRALAAIEQYLTESPSTEPNRQAALTLYTRVLPIVQADATARARHDERTAEWQGATQARTAAKAAQKPATQHATVYLFRKKGVTGSGADFIVETTAGEVGRLSNDSWMKADILAGQQTLTMRWPFETPSAPSRAELEMQLSPGQTYYFLGSNREGTIFTLRGRGAQISITPISATEFEAFSAKARGESRSSMGNILAAVATGVAMNESNRAQNAAAVEVVASQAMLVQPSPPFAPAPGGPSQAEQIAALQQQIAQMQQSQSTGSVSAPQQQPQESAVQTPVRPPQPPPQRQQPARPVPTASFEHMPRYENGENGGLIYNAVITNTGEATLTCSVVLTGLQYTGDRNITGQYRDRRTVVVYPGREGKAGFGGVVPNSGNYDVSCARFNP